MEIVVRGRHAEVPERFRAHVLDKVAKVEKLAPRALRVDVEISRERNPRLSDQCYEVELTVTSKGPVVRAEARAEDPYAALDVALARLAERLRRAADRRRVHHGNRTPVSVSAATAPSAPPVAGAQTVAATGPQTGAAAGATGSAATVPVDDGGSAVAPAVHEVDETQTAEDIAAPDRLVAVDGDGPMVIREKVHPAVPMSLDQALYEMELVGHDFFLFVDESTSRPSVVYRRRGYDYGVIRLDLQGAGSLRPAD